MTMPLPEREKLAGIVMMRVTNPKAPHYGEVGHVVDVLDESDTHQATTWLKLQFAADEKPIAYEIGELEIVMP
jgi:hypothetical protein